MDNPPSHYKPPSAGKASIPAQRSSASTASFPKPTPQTPIMSSHAMRAPIRTLFSTEANDLNEQAFHDSFFITDHLNWSPIKIEQALKKLVNYFN